MKTVSCTFDDGKEMSVRYAESKNAALHNGKVWSPGGVPMTLFTQTDLTIGKSEIPVRAYSMYVIPDKEKWTLVLNKNVAAESKYDKGEDLFRIPMEGGQLGNAVPFKVVFGHVGPKQCNMRVYYEKTGSWVEFKEK